MLKKSARKAAASEEARLTLRYVESLSAARTPLADFLSILLQNQHRITIAVEALPLANRLSISPSKKFCPSQCGNQHQQCGPWQVKIREEDIDHLEWESWCHEYLCLSPIGSELALRASRSFERAHDRGPDSDNASPSHSHLLNGANCFCSDLDPL